MKTVLVVMVGALLIFMSGICQAQNSRKGYGLNGKVKSMTERFYKSKQKGLPEKEESNLFLLTKYYFNKQGKQMKAEVFHDDSLIKKTIYRYKNNKAVKLLTYNAEDSLMHIGKRKKDSKNKVVINQFNPEGRQTEKKEYWIKHHRVVKRVHTFFVDDKSPVKEKERVTYNADGFIKSRVQVTNATLR